MASVTTMQAVNKETSYYDMASGCCGWASTKARQIMDAAANPGPTQQKVLAATRTIVGVAAIAQAPYVAIGTAVLGVVKPEWTIKAVGMAEGAISGMWHKAGYGAKMAAAAGGLAMYYAGNYMGVATLTTFAAGFSAKITATNLLMNLKKEEAAHEANESAKKLDDKYSAAFGDVKQ